MGARCTVSRMSRSLTLDGRAVSDDTDCWVIAEVGHNHQGDIEKAKDLFRAAKECGADAVKLQKRENKTLYTRAFYDKPYENSHSYGATYGEHREALEFGRDQYVELAKFCREIGITFFATAFDTASADFLEELAMPLYKLASGDLLNIPLMKHVAQFGKPMIVSVGGGTLDDVRRVYDAVTPINTQLCFLQCTMSYPTPPEEVNLRVISTLREAFPDTVVGLSDHYNGIALAPAAYVLGARVIEKHFTLQHTWKGTDHALSLEPIGMKKMVRDLKRIRAALGDGNKRVFASEKPAIGKMGKSLYAKTDLPADHLIAESDLAVKSPGGGLPPYELGRIVGRRLKTALKKDDAVQLTHLES